MESFFSKKVEEMESLLHQNFTLTVSADRYSQAVVNPSLRNRTSIRAYENGLPKQGSRK